MEFNKFDLNKAMEYNPHLKDFRKEGGRIISPSGLRKCIENPYEWYLNTTGQQVNPFMGNVDTVIGNLVHAGIEAKFSHKSITTTDVLNWLNKKKKYIKTLEGKDVHIIEVVEDSVLCFNKNWSSNNFMTDEPEYTEQVCDIDILPDLKLSGTVDAIFKNADGRGYTLVDWKVVNKKKSSIDDYKFQMYSYVIALRKKGIDIRHIEICFIVKPTITLPSRIFQVREPVDENLLRECELFVDNRVKALQILDANPDIDAEVLFPINCFVGFMKSKPRSFDSPFAPNTGIKITP